jgi:hypothetical protein|tara:strand:- start:28 stop:336 length:309 start_codon:yes stop_codon:yes gene_type:complete
VRTRRRRRRRRRRKKTVALAGIEEEEDLQNGSKNTALVVAAGNVARRDCSCTEGRKKSAFCFDDSRRKGNFKRLLPKEKRHLYLKGRNTLNTRVTKEKREPG